MLSLFGYQHQGLPRNTMNEQPNSIELLSQALRLLAERAKTDPMCKTACAIIAQAIDSIDLLTQAPKLLEEGAKTDPSCQTARAIIAQAIDPAKEQEHPEETVLPQ